MGLFGFTFARISGASMEPMLCDGNIALFRSHRRVEQGAVVLVDHPEFGMIVKRAREVADDGSIALEGTSPKSTSADRLGWVAAERVSGVLVWPRLPTGCA